MYGFGDASGPGFGSSWQQQGSPLTLAECGQWLVEVAETESSNWREMDNFVEKMEGLARTGDLDGWEVFMATDNTTFEAGYYNGYSSSPKLDGLIVRLRKLELVHSFTLHVIHVSGKRMCLQGTDGLSRGDWGSGSMRGIPLIEYLPINRSAFDRHPPLLAWIRDVCGGVGGLTELDAEGWFTTAHSFGNFIWSPPPAAADVVVEQLSQARLKRPTCFHVVVVPRLMTVYWRKHLTRACDVYFKLEHDLLWSKKDQKEPVLVFLCLPLVSHKPNFAFRKKLVDRLEWLLLGPRLQEAHTSGFRSSLRKLLSEARELSRV